MNRLPNDKPLTLAISNEIPRVGPEIFILRLKANQLYSFTILAKSYVAMWVHWQGKRSGPHYMESDRCPGCLANQPKRWKAYLHCFCHELGQEVFLELTAASVQSLLKQTGSLLTLRGCRFNCKRGKADNGRLTITMLPSMHDASALAPERDPVKSIMSLWGIDEEKTTKAQALAERFRLNGEGAQHV